jgi:hypothetical protein
MANIALDAVPDELVERLSRLAAEHGADVHEEALKCLERGLSEREQVEAELREIRAIREQSPNAWITEETIRAARDEGRA